MLLDVKPIQAVFFALFLSACLLAPLLKTANAQEDILVAEDQQYQLENCDDCLENGPNFESFNQELLGYVVAEFEDHLAEIGILEEVKEDFAAEDAQ